MYLPHIDGLRALAVLGVMMAHYALPIGKGGFLGVDVFFVISGFLITRLIAQEHAEGRFSFRRFYLRRVRRLLPAALSVIAVTLLVFLPILSANDLADLLKATPASILPVANIYYYGTVGYFDINAWARPLLHFWSLAVEEQFYFLWPALLLLALSLRPRTAPIMGAVVLAGSLGAAELIRGINFNAAYYLLPFRAFELMVGAQLALIMRHKAEAKHYLPKSQSDEVRPSVLAAIGLILVLSSFVVFDKTTPLPGVLSLLPCLGTALLIRFGAHGPIGRLFQHRITVWIGLISYSLYLVHWPIYVYLLYRLPDDPSLALKLGLFPLAILIAAANYYFIEQRFRRPARPKARFGNWPVLAGIAAAAMMLTVPTYLKYKDRSFGIRTQDAEIPLHPLGARRSQATWHELPQAKAIRIYQPRDEQVDGPRVLLFGDSHAEHLETGLVHLLIPQGFTLEAATLPGCPPLFGVARNFDLPDRDASRKICLDASSGLKERLANQEKYDAVILAARWVDMVERSDFGDLARRRELLMRPEAFSRDGKPPTSGSDAAAVQTSRNLFARQLDKSLRQLRATGKPVVVFSQVPELGNDLSRCMTLFPWVQDAAGFAKSSRCGQMPSDAKRARARFTDQLIEDTSQRHGALAVLPTKLMCGAKDQPCLQVDYADEWNLMFRDSNHLSRKGSVDLVRAAEQQLGLSAFLSDKPAIRHELAAQTEPHRRHQ
ncbi:acyltransferase family protein [Aliiroseovarius crassostreae]|uniref:acyltransferase family protein n=1 Tax=Aliiroseovarius crassostreae TaxID=154981 RepID=UPI003C7C7315